MSKPLISVIVPVYNVENYLCECLDSILAQDEKRFELIAVNDGATDSSREILAEYASLDSRVRIVDQENKGLASARNAGIDAAVGEYVAFVDSDDFVAPTYLSKMLSNARARDADVSICGRTIYDDGALRHHKRPRFSERVLGPAEAVRALNSYASFDMSMCGKLFRADLFEGIEFPVGKNSEDQFVCYKLLFKATRTFYEDAPLYCYRHRSGSISRGSHVNTFPIEASHEQLAALRKQRPELTYVGETSCFFSQVAVYNAFAIRGCELPEDIAATIREEAGSYLGSVLKNPDISKMKKAQALAFLFARPLYRRFYLSQRG